nr:MAG TPA: Mdm4 protein-RanBP domain Mdm4 protein [Caudoviricetes sp.]DAN34842.1 MAG TPA: Mdm4 protein-RanBP domain Mdm4 protein [Caudoviricetes sp.]DAU36347.1 MAG TPA: Mdm4 protein-RanBP domain Mdm4 protein [Caudoviricetes sp.]
MSAKWTMKPGVNRFCLSCFTLRTMLFLLL